MASEEGEGARGYARREPEGTVLFQVVNAHLDAFSRETSGLPSYARAELSRYLDCGVLANGFARVRCDGCGFERLVAFSCKGARRLSFLWSAADGRDGRNAGG